MLKKALNTISQSRINLDPYLARFNSLLNDKILALSKLYIKALADGSLYITNNMKFVFGRIEYIMEKGENVGYQHFLLIQHFFHRVVKSCNPRSRLRMTLQAYEM